LICIFHACVFLVLFSEFEDSIKPKNITNVTQNVMAQHHNNIKDAVIAVQEFAGKKGDIVVFFVVVVVVVVVAAAAATTAAVAV
jgi:uncharacterized membrane protein YkvI